MIPFISATQVNLKRPDSVNSRRSTMQREREKEVGRGEGRERERAREKTQKRWEQRGVGQQVEYTKQTPGQTER